MEINSSAVLPPDGLTWRSASGDECIEVAQSGGTVFLKNPRTGEHCITATPAEWARFRDGVKNEVFDGGEDPVDA